MLNWVFTQLGGFVWRTLFSTVGVCRWHSYLWQTWIANASHQCSAGNQTVVIFEWPSYLVHFLIRFIFCRVQKLKGQFAHLYVVVVLPTKEQNELFVHSYFKWVIWNLCPNWLFGCLSDMKELLVSLCDRYGMELGKPTFVPVEDSEMGFEKIVKIALSRGGKSLFSNDHFNGFFKVVSLSNHMNCSMQTTGCHNKIKGWGQLIRIIYMLYFCAYKFSININNINYYFLQMHLGKCAYLFLFVKRKQSVQAMDVFLRVLTSIPGIENHDANAVILYPIQN